MITEMNKALRSGNESKTDCHQTPNPLNAGIKDEASRVNTITSHSAHFKEDLTLSPSAFTPPVLAKASQGERICADAPSMDPASVERLCLVWAEVGRAILARRSKSND